MVRTNRRQFVQWLSVAGASTALAGCLSGGPVERTNSVDLTDDGFDPKNAKIESEGSMSWENRGSVTHIISDESGDLRLEIDIGPGKLANHEFMNDGVYTIVCAKHDGERMKVAVGDAEIDDPIE